MSLITRCPACQTLFKVVPDQLRISEGWVRCGRCSEIFDASLALLPDAAPELAAVASPTPTPSPSSEDTPAMAPSAIEASPSPEQADSQPVDMVAQQPADNAPPKTDVEDSVTVVHLEPVAALLSEFGSDGLLRPDDSGLSEPVLLQGLMDITSESFDPELLVKPSTEVAAASDTQTELAAPSQEVSFLDRGQGNSFWQRRVVRVLMWLFAVLLLLLLAVQIVFHERDRIVAMQPSLKPWMQVFCQSLDCSLAPLRQSEAIVIESSTFTKIRSDAYQLNFALKNTSTMAAAIPSVELTLTDTQDQPVVRRIFAPENFGAKVESLAAGAELAGTLAVSFKSTEATDKVAGYRLLVFYP